MTNIDTRLTVLTKKQLRAVNAPHLTASQREHRINTYIDERICKMDVAHSRMVEGPLVK